MAEPHQEALLSNEPSDMQSEAMTASGQPAPQMLEAPGLVLTLALSPGPAGPAPAAVYSSTVTTQANG